MALSIVAVPEQTLVLGDRLETDILGAVRHFTEQGFSLGNILKRTRFYADKFRRAADAQERAKSAIKKTIFVFVLQNKMKKGVIGLANAAIGASKA